jgi:hypothetical protein
LIDAGGTDNTRCHEWSLVTERDRHLCGI